VALLPGGIQLALHGVVGPLEHGEVTRAFGVGVGVGEKLPLCRHPRCADGGHDGLLGHATCGGPQTVRLGQSSQHLSERPAFDQAHHGQPLVALHHHAQEISWGGASTGLVVASPDLAGVSGNTEPLVQQPGRGVDACGHPIAGDVARGLPRFDRKFNRLGSQGQRPMQPPCGDTGQQDGAKQQRAQQGAQHATSLMAPKRVARAAGGGGEYPGGMHVHEGMIIITP